MGEGQSSDYGVTLSNSFLHDQQNSMISKIVNTKHRHSKLASRGPVGIIKLMVHRLDNLTAVAVFYSIVVIISPTWLGKERIA